MEPLTPSLTVVMSQSYLTHHFTMTNIFRILAMELTNPSMIEVLCGLACCLKEVLNLILDPIPCVMCSKACKTECIACDECNQWVHRTCIGMSTTEFSRLRRSEEAWSCPSCASINNSTRIYSVPDEDDQDATQSLNYSTHPSMLDSVSEISFPS